MKKNPLEKKFHSMEHRSLTSEKTVNSFSKKEHLFFDIFLSMPVAVTINQLSDGHFIHINSSFLKLTGLRKKEVIGKNLKQIPFEFTNTDFKTIIEKLSDGKEFKNVKLT